MLEIEIDGFQMEAKNTTNGFILFVDGLGCRLMQVYLLKKGRKGFMRQLLQGIVDTEVSEVYLASSNTEKIVSAVSRNGIDMAGSNWDVCDDSGPWQWLMDIMEARI